MDVYNSTGTKILIRIFTNPMDTFDMSIMSTFRYNDEVETVSTDSFSRALKHLQ